MTNLQVTHTMPRQLGDLVKDLRHIADNRFGYAKFDMRALCAEVADRLDAIDRAGRDVYEFIGGPTP